MKTIEGPKKIQDHEDIVFMTGDAYCLSAEGLKHLLSELHRLGYDVKDLTTEEERNNSIGRHRVYTPEEMRENNHSIYYASLHLSNAKCGSCGKLSTITGSRVHGHKCPHCGEVMYYEMVDGSLFRFRFRDEEYRMIEKQPVLKVKSWDIETGELLLYRDKDARLYGLTVEGDESPEEILEKNKNAWEPVTIDGERFIKVIYDRYPHLFGREQRLEGVECMDIHGHYFNSSQVQVWDGKEYSEFDFKKEIPVPVSLSIYEAWHSLPWKADEVLHEKLLRAAGQVARQDYYHGGQHFNSPVIYDRIYKAIKYFTELDENEFKEVFPFMRKDGPGFIEDLGAFCAGDKAKIRCEPNPFCTMDVMVRAMSGEDITEAEYMRAQQGMWALTNMLNN